MTHDERQHIRELRAAYLELLTLYIGTHDAQPGETTELDLLLWVNELAGESGRKGYGISEDGKAITCLKCGLTSHNPNDVEQRYCGRCYEFYEAERVRKLLLDADENLAQETATSKDLGGAPTAPRRRDT